MNDHLPTPAVPTICPSCGNHLAAIQPDRSTHFVCEKCTSYFVDAWDEEKAVLSNFKGGSLRDAPLQPGTKGRLLSKSYVVAGITRRFEKYDPKSMWIEYHLYGSGETAAVLVEFEGEWLLVRPATGVPKKQGGDSYRFENATYTAFHSYAPGIAGAAGSFDYNILEDQLLSVREYEHNGRRLIVEVQPSGEEAWFHAVPVGSVIVSGAFRLPSYSLPGGTNAQRTTKADNPYAPQLKWLYRIAFIAVGIVALLQTGINYFHPSSELLNTTYTANSDSLTTAGEKPLASQGFHVQSKSALSVDLEAPLSNNWLEVSAVLVNDKTGAVFESMKNLEEYHGYEGGESWSEGSNAKSVVFSSVPPGDYHLNITSTGDATNGFSANMPLKVRVSHENWLLSNFFLILVVIAGFPIVVQMLSNQFNKTH